MKTLNERATEILKALLAVRAYRIDHGNGVYPLIMGNIK